ncbi:tRNA pseudouridine synthase family protein [Cryptosporidium felis]|nr:tRNA pseudouridine synthase family protein [Cryptosporidium felis]
MQEVLPTRTYCMAFGYDGSEYHGMQIQMRNNRKVEELKTIEGEMEDCLERLDLFCVASQRENGEVKGEKDGEQRADREERNGHLEEEEVSARGQENGGGLLRRLRWSRVGRTDKGVHSACQVASFRAKIRVTKELKSILEGKESNENVRQSCERLERERRLLNETEGEKPQSSGNPLLCTKSVSEDENPLLFLDELLILDHIVSRLNSLLKDRKIQVFKIFRVTKNFDARTDCSRRRYEYLMPEFLLSPAKISNDGLREELLAASQEKYQQGLMESKNHQGKRRKRESTLRTGSDCPGSEDEETAEKEERVKVFEQHQLNRMNNYGLGNDFRLVDYDIRDYSESDRRRFKLSSRDLEEFQAILTEYIGTHSFHNFTSKSTFTDPTSWRHIEEISVCKVPVGQEGGGVPLVKIVILGQSFLLHQIRKMVALAIEIFRGTAPKNAIRLCFLPDKFSIHLAPSQGLLLDRVFYNAYNTKRSTSTDQREFAVKFLTFHNQKCDFVREIELFKTNTIYSKIRESINTKSENR